MSCSRGTFVGETSYFEIASVSAFGDHLLILGGYSTELGGRRALVLRLPSLERVGDWVWDVGSGSAVGPPTSPALLTLDEEYHPIDLATGALGIPKALGESAVGGSRVLRGETHLNGREYLVLDAAGEILRSPQLEKPADFVAAPGNRVFLDDGIVGIQTHLERVQLARWDYEGKLVAERALTIPEAGVLSRRGEEPVLVRQSAVGTEVVPLTATFEMGPAVPAAESFSDVGAQADGVTFASSQARDDGFDVSGAHVTPDGQVFQFAASCTHQHAGPSSKVYVAREAARPTWVWNVGSETFVHVE